jgi:hypothetical protein
MGDVAKPAADQSGLESSQLHQHKPAPLDDWALATQLGLSNGQAAPHLGPPVVVAWGARPNRGKA